MDTLSGEETLPFSFLSSSNQGVKEKNLLLEQVLSFKNILLWKSFVLQESKLEITKVVPLCKSGRKTWRCTQNLKVPVFVLCIILYCTHFKCLNPSVLADSVDLAQSAIALLPLSGKSIWKMTDFLGWGKIRKFFLFLYLKPNFESQGKSGNLKITGYGNAFSVLKGNIRYTCTFRKDHSCIEVYFHP